MYSVDDVSSMTGVGRDTLRAWQQQYGVVAPRRAGEGPDVFTDLDLAALRRMAKLVRDGVPERLAAQRVAVGDAVPADGGGGFPPVTMLVGSALRMDPRGVRHALDAAFAAGELDVVIDQWLMPALRAIGEAWEQGRAGVAEEHFATQAVRMRLDALLEATQTTDDGPSVIVGLGPGTRHELPALAFAICLRHLGVDVIYLGPDVPVESWRYSVVRRHPDAVVIGVPLGSDVDGAAEVVDTLREAAPEVVIFTGGGFQSGVANVERLPDELGEAAAQVADRLGVTRSPSTGRIRPGRSRSPGSTRRGT